VTYTKEKWLEIFSKWEQSGLTRTEYCRRHKLALTTFDYWRRKFRMTSGIKPELVKLSVKSPQSPAPLVLELTGGYRLIVPAGYQSAHLKRLINDIREVQ
jgi:transposase-like protein